MLQPFTQELGRTCRYPSTYLLCKDLTVGSELTDEAKRNVDRAFKLRLPLMVVDATPDRKGDDQDIIGHAHRFDEIVKITTSKLYAGAG